MTIKAQVLSHARFEVAGCEASPHLTYLPPLEGEEFGSYQNDGDIQVNEALSSGVLLYTRHRHDGTYWAQYSAIASLCSHAKNTIRDDLSDWDISPVYVRTQFQPRAQEDDIVIIINHKTDIVENEKLATRLMLQSDPINSA